MTRQPMEGASPVSSPLIDRIGGEAGLGALVERFHDLVESEPEAASLRRLHLRGQGIAHARVEQLAFLSGFMDGRRYHLERHGHMDVRAKHAHVPIRTEDAETWLALMDRALAEEGHEGSEIERLRATLRRVALMLVNDLGERGMRGMAEPRRIRQFWR